MERKYIATLILTADTEEIEKYGSVQDMIFETTEEVPFCFDIEDCREVLD